QAYGSHVRGVASSPAPWRAASCPCWRRPACRPVERQHLSASTLACAAPTTFVAYQASRPAVWFRGCVRSLGSDELLGPWLGQLLPEKGGCLDAAKEVVQHEVLIRCVGALVGIAHAHQHRREPQHL